jgi:hypothetical protein
VVGDLERRAESRLDELALEVSRHALTADEAAAELLGGDARRDARGAARPRREQRTYPAR